MCVATALQVYHITYDIRTTITQQVCDCSLPLSVQQLGEGVGGSVFDMCGIVETTYLVIMFCPITVSNMANFIRKSGVVLKGLRSDLGKFHLPHSCQ